MDLIWDGKGGLNLFQNFWEEVEGEQWKIPPPFNLD